MNIDDAVLVNDIVEAFEEYGDSHLVEDEDGAPYPDDVQKALRLLADEIAEVRRAKDDWGELACAALQAAFELARGQLTPATSNRIQDALATISTYAPVGTEDG